MSAVRGGLRAELLEPDSPTWATTLAASRHDFYHLPAYAALCAGLEHGRAAALHVADGERAMLLPLILRPIPASRVDAVSPYGYPGPVGRGTDDPAFLQEALESGAAALRSSGVVAAFIRLHPLLNPSRPLGVGTVVVHGPTVSIDLTPSPEARWSQLRLNHRRDIRRALDLGYAARVDDDWTRLGDFERLYAATMDRRSASRFYRFDHTYFAGLRDALGGRLLLCVVEHEGAVVAAGLYALTGQIAQYHLSGTDEAAGRVQATKLMMTFVADWASDRGATVLHLGGGVGAGDDSLLRFKAGFSPRRHPFATLRLVIDEDEYRRLVLALDPVLDPTDHTGYFPLFRSAAHAAG